MSSNRLSPAVRSEVADRIAQNIERHVAANAPAAGETDARVLHRHARVTDYGVAFAAVASNIDTALGRSAAWRQKRRDLRRGIGAADETVDYLLIRIHNDLLAESTLELTRPEHAASARATLQTLFPVQTLAQLIGLPEDREAPEVGKLLSAAASPPVASALTALGVAGYIPRLTTAHAEYSRLLAERNGAPNSGAPSGRAAEVSEAFGELMKRFDGFLADAFDTPALARTAESLRAPYTDALAKDAALERAAATRAKNKPVGPAPAPVTPVDPTPAPR